MSLAPWRSPLARALHRNRSRPFSRYFQLATVRSDGTPANRTVVFRGFQPDSNTLLIITDQRSQKIGDLAGQPWAEACWYFTESREQFRLLGQLQLVVQQSPEPLQTLRQQVWQGLSAAARSQFSWPHPGQPRAESSAFEVALPAPPALPAAFSLLLLVPTRVDHLALRGSPQDRTQYRLEADEAWAVEAVNP